MNKNDFIFSLSELFSYLKEKNVNLNKINIPFDPERIPGLNLLVSKYYLELIDWNDLNDPIKKMVIPDKRENEVKTYELEDPNGDKTHSPVPGIIHRYPDRCLLNLTNICGVHCRFCFRKNLLDDNYADFEACIEYIRKHHEIWEVILSGGDPFMITDNFLTKIISGLRQLNHIKVIRFHTRIPVVYPKRITNNLVNALKRAYPLIIVIHINHYKEITREFIKAIETLKKTSAILLSQAVLLKGVNNDEDTLSRLFKGLIEMGIKPYYLHHLDLAKGTDHFRVSVKEGKSLLKKLRGSISGVCIPEYVIDIPGGFGKIPVFWFKEKSKNYIDNSTHALKQLPKLFLSRRV